MRIKIIGDNLKISPRIRKLVVEKIGRGLEKYLPSLNQEIKTATMTITKRTRWGYKVNFDMRLPENYQIFAEEKQETLLTALVKLREALGKQIKKYKEGLKAK